MSQETKRTPREKPVMNVEEFNALFNQCVDTISNLQKDVNLASTKQQKAAQRRVRTTATSLSKDLKRLKDATFSFEPKKTNN